MNRTHDQNNTRSLPTSEPHTFEALRESLHWPNFFVLGISCIPTYIGKTFLLQLRCLGPDQRDQMVRLFFNIWPFAMIKNSPIMLQIRQK